MKIDRKVRAYRMDRRIFEEDIRFAMGTFIEKKVLEIIKSEIEPEDFKNFGNANYVPRLTSLFSQTEALRNIARLVKKARKETAWHSKT